MRNIVMEEEAKEEPKENEEDQNTEQKSEEDSPEISKEDQIKDLEDKLLRSAAEIENIRKRAEKERSEAYKHGSKCMANSILHMWKNRNMKTMTNRTCTTHLQT